MNNNRPVITYHFVGQGLKYKLNKNRWDKHLFNVIFMLGYIMRVICFDENKMHLCPPPDFWDLPDGITSQSLDLILQFAAPSPWIL